MKTDWRVEAPQIAILVLMFAAAVITWPTAPDRIPVHWNVVGQVDRYGGKIEGLLAVPLVAAATYLLLRFLPRVDPGKANYAAFSTTYTVMRVATLLVLGAIYAVIHMWIRGREVSVNTVVPVLVGGLFVLIGALMGKLRPNWFVGIRTPWTLSSKNAWVRTHRAGGWLFIAHGLMLMLVMPFANPQRAFLVLVVGVSVIAGWSMIYSYMVWKNDPDKVPPAGTTPADSA